MQCESTPYIAKETETLREFDITAGLVLAEVVYNVDHHHQFAGRVCPGQPQKGTLILSTLVMEYDS